MTTTHHTPLPFGGPLTSAAMEAPLSQLDAAVQAITVGSGGWATTLDSMAGAGQKVVPVTSTANAVAGMPVYIGLTSGTHEVGVIDTISAGVSVTLVANLTSTYSSGAPISATPAEVADARGGYATLLARLLTGLGQLDVRAYGATGDGVTNDTAAIQAAITAAPVGAAVFFPRGTYLITGTITGTLPIRLLGEGTEHVGSRIYQATANTPAFSFNAPYGEARGAVEFERLEIEGQSGDTSGAAIVSTGDVHITNCRIVRFYDGAQIGTAYFSRYIESSFTEQARAGIYVTTGNNIEVTHCAFWRPAYGIHIAGHQGARIRDCVFENVTTADIWVDGGGSGGHNGAVVIEGNYFEGSGANVIIGPSVEVRNVRIAGNWFDSVGASNYCVELGYADHVTFDNNGYRGIGLGEASGTANTKNVLFLNQQHTSVVGMPLTTRFIDPIEAIRTGGVYESDILATPDVENFWPLDEWSGTVAADIRLNENPGTIAGSPTLGAVGPLALEPSRGITFDGSVNQKVDGTRQEVLTTTLTMEAWVKFAGTPGDATIFGNTVASIILYADGTTFYFFAGGYVAYAFPTDGLWHHYAGKSDGTNTSLYIDGALVAGPTANATFTTAAKPLIIGYKVPGSVSRVAWYSRALTTAEILRHYRIGSGT